MLLSSIISFIRGIITFCLMLSYSIKEPNQKQEYCTYLACSCLPALTLLELFEHFIKSVERFCEKNRVNGQNNAYGDNEEQSTLRRFDTQSKKEEKNKIVKEYKC